jgi:hypothetical protein
MSPELPEMAAHYRDTRLQSRRSPRQPVFPGAWVEDHATEAAATV